MILKILKIILALLKDSLHTDDCGMINQHDRTIKQVTESFAQKSKKIF